MQTLFTDQASKLKPKHSHQVRKEANLNAIVENFDGYVWSIDTSFEYIVLNTALRNKIKEILGVDPLPGDKVLDILEAIDASKTNTWSMIYQAAFAGESQRFVDEFQLAGKPAFFEVSVNPIRYEGTVTGLSCFARDITEEVMNDRRLQATEMKVRESEGKFRRLVEISTDMILMADAQGNFIYGSPSVQKFLGYEERDYLGQLCLMLVHPNSRDYANNLLAQILHHPGKLFTLYLSLIHKDGSEIPVEGLASNMLDVPGVNALVANFRDISERKKAEKIIQESEYLYRNLFNNNPLPIWVCEATSLRFLEVNEAAIQHYGYSRKEFLKMTAYGLVPPHEHEELKFVLAAACKQNDRLQRNHIRRNGDQVFVEVMVHQINYKGKNSYLVLSNDITEKIRLQNQLIEEKLHRHQEIMQATIEAAEKEREDIGRELHDNVTQILTTARLCLSCIDNLNPARNMIDRSSITITTAIEEIRNLSRAMIQSFHSEIGMKLSLENLVEDINLPNKFQVSLDYYLPDEQLLDDKLKMTLFRIIQEQLNNIVKHAEASEISILLRQCEDSIDLSISDNGKGFNVFERRKGIGITNIINRAELFNGQVHIDSSPGNGCRIEVNFPK